MDASPRHNSPSRKSRFRAQATAPRPAARAAGDAPATDADSPLDLEGKPYPGTPLAEPEATADDLAGPLPPMEEPAGPAEAAGHLSPTGHFPPVPPVEHLPPPTGAAGGSDDLLPNFRLTRSTEHTPARRSGVPVLGVVLLSLLFLALGGAGGYLVKGQDTAGGRPAAGGPKGPDARVAPPPLALGAEVQAEVDAAFSATKQGQFADARQRFTTLAARHPDWPSMQIEAARAALYQRDAEGTQHILTALERDAPNADAEFLSGLLHMTAEEYDKSESAFGRAVALDPARPDFFYFWGEALRREGKPQQAAAKFRAALLRNQYETTEGLYQLKLWLSEIQSDQEEAKAADARIDADLGSGHPSGPGLFAAAARAVKAGDFKAAGGYIGQAQKVMEPAVFRVILQDPTFLQENYQPDIAPFYKQ